VPISRRAFIVTTLALASPACNRPISRPQAGPFPPLPAEFDGWNQEAKGILSDALQTVRTFDVFQAFRVSTATHSDVRLGAELGWDPPTSAEWNEATHVSRGVHGRAEQLFQAVTTARIDPNAWREQRAVADATRDLIDLAAALGTYRDRIDSLPPGDASSALAALDSAWSQWEAAAARWGVSRAQMIDCRSSA
jgi:hypothetical protein